MKNQFFDIQPGQCHKPKNVGPETATYFILLDKEALLIADPLPANYTTDTGTHPLGYGDHLVNLIYGGIDNSLGPRNF